MFERKRENEIKKIFKPKKVSYPADYDEYIQKVLERIMEKDKVEKTD